MRGNKIDSDFFFSSFHSIDALSPHVSFLLLGNLTMYRHGTHSATPHTASHILQHTRCNVHTDTHTSTATLILQHIQSLIAHAATHSATRTVAYGTHKPIHRCRLKLTTVFIPSSRTVIPLANIALLLWEYLTKEAYSPSKEPYSICFQYEHHQNVNTSR